MAKKFPLFAFWHYDLFPFCIGAGVEEMKEGAFRPEGYGYHWFHMHAGVSLTTEKIGRPLKEELENLKSEYAREIKALNKQFEKRRQEIFAAAGVAVPQSIQTIEHAQKLLKQDKLERKLGFKESA